MSRDISGYAKDAFQTTSGDTWYRATDSSGRDYVVKKGDGIVGYMSNQKTRSRWAAAKSHTPEAAVAERGQEVDSALANVDKAKDGLSEPTMGMDPGSVEYRLGVNKNKWLGYLNAEDTPDDANEAFQQYSAMIDELKDAETSDERDEIRREYNVGDSP